MLATILLPVALAAAFFVTKIRRAQEELEQTKKAASDWQRRYDEEQQAANRLEKELREANASLAEQRHQPETPSERETQTHPDEEREVARSSPHKSRPGLHPEYREGRQPGLTRTGEQNHHPPFGTLVRSVVGTGKQLGRSLLSSHCHGRRLERHLDQEQPQAAIQRYA